MNLLSTRRRTVTLLRPLSFDAAAARSLARRAIQARTDAEPDTGAFLSVAERDVGEGTATGALRVDGERVVGIALWEPPTELGVTLDVVFEAEGWQTPADYRSLLAELPHVAGPVVFAPRGLAGLSEGEEEQVMRALGFARFARSEMRSFLRRPLPEGPARLLGRAREARAVDEVPLARLHERAYRDHFDRYLHLVYRDPGRDADLVMREVLGGRWGEFLPWASPVIEERGSVVAATLVVRSPAGPLVADVMVDPGFQGQGLGRAVLSWTLRALTARREPVVVLNVTERNARAVHLYEQLGFVRTLGPSYGWYSTERIPVSPGPG